MALRVLRELNSFFDLATVPLVYLPCLISQLSFLSSTGFWFCSKWGACSSLTGELTLLTLPCEWSFFVAQWTLSMVCFFLMYFLVHLITWEVTVEGLPNTLDASTRCHTLVWALERGLGSVELAPFTHWLLGHPVLHPLLPEGSVE